MDNVSLEFFLCSFVCFLKYLLEYFLKHKNKKLNFDYLIKEIKDSANNSAVAVAKTHRHILFQIKL